VIAWIKRKLEQRRKAKDEWLTILAIRSLVYANWNTAKTEYYRSYTKEHSFDKKFTVGTVDVEFFREIRGDLVTAKIGDRVIVAFVDQSHAYPGILGINDPTVNVTLAELHAAIGEVR